MSSIADEKMRAFYEAQSAGLVKESPVKDYKTGDIVTRFEKAIAEDKAMRFNDGKLNWSLVHFDSLKPMVRVLMFGAKKYAPGNWKKGLNKSEILESMFRHLTALMDGETHDPESGELHIGHIFCNAMFWTFFYNKENK